MVRPKTKIIAQTKPRDMDQAAAFAVAFFQRTPKIRDGNQAAQAAVAKVTKELGDTGRILVRESGTEPVIRVMVEAGTDEICEKYVDSVIDVIKAKGHLA